jgi:hypothetical protein
VEVSAPLATCCSSTSLIFWKASFSCPSVICGRAWEDGSGVALSPGCERRWLTLLGGTVRVVFLSLKYGECQMLVFKSEGLNPEHEIRECKMQR